VTIPPGLSFIEVDAVPEALHRCLGCSGDPGALGRDILSRISTIPEGQSSREQVDSCEFPGMHELPPSYIHGHSGWVIEPDGLNATAQAICDLVTSDQKGPSVGT
jgi:hypothetical protein